MWDIGSSLFDDNHLFESSLHTGPSRSMGTAVDKCLDSFWGFWDENTVNCFMERRLQEIIVVK